ncbi:MAG: hypothetical protein HC921_08460 [Synechococcaceae cyanobacterium SM2_3_1]|nr:hypothetical protein [Synechococcaceae cyanobacterium SM2_3_1]
MENSDPAQTLQTLLSKSLDLLDPARHGVLKSAIVRVQSSSAPPEFAEIKALGHQALYALQDQVKVLQDQVENQPGKQAREVELKQRAQTLIQKGYEESLKKLRLWLSSLHDYDQSLQMALAEYDFDSWFQANLEYEWNERSREWIHWVHKAAEIFKLNPPPDPKLKFPPAPQLPVPRSAGKENQPDNTPVWIATGVGWLLGGPMGAAVLGGASYLINRADSAETNPTPPEPLINLERDLDILDWSQAAAHQYLEQFRRRAEAIIDDYIPTAEPLIHPQIQVKAIDVAPQKNQLEQTRALVQDLEQVLTAFGESETA